MTGLTFNNFLEFIGALLIAIGGATGLILGLSKWFGGILAEKLLNKDKAKYQEKLENLKSKYQTELENTKTELDKSKSLFYRYSEHQFLLYNELWKSLMDLKFIAIDLWEELDTKRLKEFSNQLKETSNTVEKNILLIEKEHYRELVSLLKEFEDFQFGKSLLGDLRNKSVHQMSEAGINRAEIKFRIENNGAIKERFTELLDKIADEFRDQIKGK